MSPPRLYRAGESVEDFCRACKTDRMHTIIVVDAEQQPLRTMCGYCRSEHNYRGGPRVDATGPAAAAASAPKAPAPRETSRAAPDHEVRRPLAGRYPFPIVADRERTAPKITEPNHATGVDLEMLLRRIIREEAGVSEVVPADKWRGGSFVLRPGTPGLQEKSWPIETFFHKVVMLRNRLRTLEQQVNASDLADDVKVKLQSYISGCYGSLTSFNVLFAEDDDQFKGAGGD